MLKGSIPTVVSEGSIDDTSVASLAFPFFFIKDKNEPEGVSHVTGVKVKLSGRLTTQRAAPRQTVQAGRIGSSAKGQYSTVDYSQHTAKNKLGAFTMKV